VIWRDFRGFVKVEWEEIGVESGGNQGCKKNFGIPPHGLALVEVAKRTQHDKFTQLQSE
jgi:hypothetical protein